MSWIPRRFLLPVFLSLSLISVGGAMVYLYVKDEKERKSVTRNGIRKERSVTIEYRVPRQHVPAVIGRCGATIKDVEKKTDSNIFFMPDTMDDHRVCLIKGSAEGVNFAKTLIDSIIKNQPVIETFEIPVPQWVCNKIMHDPIRQRIQFTSSAKIMQGDFHRDLDKETQIIIKGTTEQIDTAMRLIEEKIREVKEGRARLEASSASRQPRGKSSPRNTSSNAAEQSQATDVSPLQVPDSTMEVYVCAMATPSQFWVQVIGAGITALDKLVLEMSEYYSNEENQQLHTLKNINVGQIVAAKFSLDQQWYRGEIISLEEDRQCDVYFLDYGDHEMMDMDCVFELRTDFLSLKFQAVECSLANVKPRHSDWSTRACERFGDLTWVAQWKILAAKVRRYRDRKADRNRRWHREGSPIPCIELYDTSEDQDINIGQVLINEDLAVPDDGTSLLSEASSTLSLSMRSHEVASTSSSVSPRPGNESEMLAKAERGYDSNTASPSTSVVELDSASTEEINLATPKKETEGRVEQIDLVTPKGEESIRFIGKEAGRWVEDGGGDYGPRNEGTRNGRESTKPLPHFPGGYESDVSDDSELELG